MAVLPWPFADANTSEERRDDANGLDLRPGMKRQPSVTTLLRQYDAPGVPPPSARVDPKVKQQESQPIRIWDAWKYAALLATKGIEISWDVLSHIIWGPKRKTWGIEMTLLSSIMRNAGRHSHLADVATIRALMSLGGLAPVPSDAFVTPVTFHVRKRHLRGLLAEFDACEDGQHELSGEWVVGKKLRKRLQTEWKAARQLQLDGVASGSSSKPLPPRKKERVILYLHGGAYYTSSAATHRLITIALSKYTDSRVFAVDYRLAPETRFPGPLHDAVSTYIRLVDDLHIPSENIIIAGDSAGGGLSVALMMYLRDNGYPLPAAAILLSPWVDLTMSCDSWESNAQYDIVPIPTNGDHLDPVACYLGEHMEKYLTHSYASPLFGDLKGLPPMMITSGDAEVLRDEITLFAHKASLAGIQVRHELYEDCVHVFQALPFLDATRRSFVSCRDFVKNVLPAYQSQTPQVLGGSAEAEMEQEIDTNEAKVVRGDGMETDTTKTDVESEMKEGREERPEDEEVSSSEEELSWTRKETPWPSPPPSDGEEDEDRTAPVSQDYAKTTSATPQSEGKALGAIHRIGSALSFLAEKTASSSRHHRRTPSSGSQAQDHHRHLHVAHPNLSASSTLRAPKPSIRRNNVSHPDIRSLVRQWENSGPANQTTMYKRDGQGSDHKRSKSKSFSITPSS